MTFNYAEMNYVNLFASYLNIDIHFTIFYLIIVGIKAISTKSMFEWIFFKLRGLMLKYWSGPVLKVI